MPRQVIPVGLLMGLTIIPSVVPMLWDATMPSIPYADMFLDAIAFKLGADLMLENTDKTWIPSAKKTKKKKKTKAN